MHRCYMGGWNELEIPCSTATSMAPTSPLNLQALHLDKILESFCKQTLLCLKMMVAAPGRTISVPATASSPVIL